MWTAGYRGKKVKIACAAAAVGCGDEDMMIVLILSDYKLRPCSGTGGCQPLVMEADFKQCRLMWDLW
jgi:hypothetical protein